MSTPAPRIALIGFQLETNGFAPIATEDEFRAKVYLAGAALTEDLGSAAPRASATTSGFAAAMDATGPWQPVPIVETACNPSGPVDQAFFDRLLGDMRRRLDAAGPLDGVYCALHGAASATADPDPDGTILSMVRDVVGSDVPVVGTLDLHTNLSRRMVAAADLLIAFLTNPHVDLRERGLEAGQAMRRLLTGDRTAKAFIKLPLLPPSVALLTSHGAYADVVRRGQERLAEPIANVSACANFSLADSPKNGMAVLVTAWTREAGPDAAADAADALARDLAGQLWRDRPRLEARLTPLDAATEEAAAVARTPDLPPLLLADVADNPGGGGRGNTMHLLESLYRAGVTGAVVGIVFDPDLAAEAHGLPIGTAFTARFNRSEDSPHSAPFAAPAVVAQLSDGEIVGRRGMAVGRKLSLGPTVRLRLPVAGKGGAPSRAAAGGTVPAGIDAPAIDPPGIDVVVVSIRHQLHEPRMIEHVGVDLAAVRVLAVKSRGHFRAAFDERFPPDRIREVDCPGLVTPILARVPFRHVPRPIYPLDPDTGWSVPEPGAGRVG